MAAALQVRQPFYLYRLYQSAIIEKSIPKTFLSAYFFA